MFIFKFVDIMKKSFKYKGGYLMRKYFCILGSLLLMTIFIQGKALAQDDVIAKIGDRKITVSEFNKVLKYFDAERQKAIEKNPQLKETILLQYIQGVVISNLAKQKSFDKNPQIKEQIEFYKDNYLANEYLKKEVAEKVKVTEEEIKSYYESHKDEFKTPEMIRARHILIQANQSASESDKKKAKEKAENILKKIKDGEDFAKLATELSEDPGSKSKGGDLGFIPRGKTVKPFEDAVFSLKPGEPGIVETQFGYHIIKVEEKREPAFEPFEQAKERISQKLAQERMKSTVTEFIEHSMKDAGVEIYSEKITGSKQ
jgi:peptidyl-prolyl cis-trans isomerase C